jgi:hypothetical protein
MIKLVHINKVGGDLYVVREAHLPVDPGFGVGGGHPDQGLPGSPAHPDHDLPHLPGIPDNSLPTRPPGPVMPGMVLVLARAPDGKWHWAAIPANVPVQPLPEPPPAMPGQGLPPTAAPKA